MTTPFDTELLSPPAGADLGTPDLARIHEMGRARRRLRRGGIAAAAVALSTAGIGIPVLIGNVTDRADDVPVTTSPDHGALLVRAGQRHRLSGCVVRLNGERVTVRFSRDGSTATIVTVDGTVVHRMDVPVAIATRTGEHGRKICTVVTSARPKTKP
ncbi:MAG: hypothetical protein QM638_18605 [Nocardioides sp.]|uniref:hypothetical protein n=1 Tax=Nocardioides sp. TaxID=35761 RepID=UPI0039E298B5